MNWVDRESPVIIYLQVDPATPHLPIDHVRTGRRAMGICTVDLCEMVLISGVEILALQCKHILAFQLLRILGLEDMTLGSFTTFSC